MWNSSPLRHLKRLVLLVTPNAVLNAAFFNSPCISEPPSRFQHRLAARLRWPPRFMCSWRCSCSRNICREKPVLVGKVTCGVRNETSGQSWPSNTVATESVHRAKPEFKMWQRYPAQTSGRLAAKDFVPSVSSASLHWDGWQHVES